MPARPSTTLVVDNGSYTIKAGFATGDATPGNCLRVPNCLARARDKRVLVGQQLDGCRDFGSMSFRRPVEKGYLVNWEAEKEIWDRTFLDSESKLQCDPRDTVLLLTEAPNAPSTLQSNCDQMVFEEYEFSAYYRCVGPTLIPWNNISALQTPNSKPSKVPAEACLVVDSGFSHTHIAPVINGQLWNSSVRRIDIGGKFLTNYLKEMVSLRTYNMMEEPHLVNQVKESVCYVSTDFSADLEKCKLLKNSANPIVVDYVLPDYNSGKTGHRRAHVPKKQGPVSGRDDDQVMVLGNERFTVPELLFSPADVGLKQAGIAEATMQSLENVPERYRNLLLANIVVVGGNTNLPGFLERFESELRPLAPAEAVVRIVKPEDPITYAWQGGVALARNKGEMKKKQVTRMEYLEYGSVWCAKKMAGETVGGGEAKNAGHGEFKESRSHKKRRIDDS